MKSILVVVLSLTSGPGISYARSNPGLSCAQAQALVQSRGAVVLNTGRGTYDRFVSSSYYCANGETTRPAWIRTADSANCFVGYTCEPNTNGD